MEYYTQVKKEEKYILNYKKSEKGIEVNYANGYSKTLKPENEEQILVNMENQAYEVLNNEQIAMNVKKDKVKIIKQMLNDTTVIALLAGIMQTTEIGRDPLLVTMGLLVEAGIIALGSSALSKLNKKEEEIEKLKIYFEYIKDNEYWFPKTHSALAAKEITVNTLDSIPLKDLKTMRNNIISEENQTILQKRLI